MSNAPGVVAKAFLDALPTLDFNKLVAEATREYGIAFVGDEPAVEEVLLKLRGHGDVPADVKLVLWRHIQNESAPIPVGKTELVIVAPASDEHLKTARDTFPGVGILPVVLDDAASPDGVAGAVKLKGTESDEVNRVLIPELVERMWERRLALGRAAPATRDHIAWRLTTSAAKDVKVILGSVAGAGGGESGAPTAATAQLLMHQAALIVSLAAIYGVDLEDRRAIFARVAPNLAPTLLLDGAEAGISRLAAEAGKGNRYEKLYGPLAAYVTRPTLTASSTFLAGLTARRVFRTNADAKSILERTRGLGKRVVVGAGQGAAVAGGLVAARLGLRRSGQPAADDANETGQVPTPPSEPSPDAGVDD